MAGARRTIPLDEHPTRVRGARRVTVEVTGKRKPRPVPMSAAQHRRVMAESVSRNEHTGRVEMADFAHVRSTMAFRTGRPTATNSAYLYRGAGGQLSPKQLAAARRNLEIARARRHRRG